MIKMNDERVLHEFETYLEHCFDHLPASRTKEAMKYSLLAPGKRVRPMLLFGALNDYGMDYHQGFAFGAAIEMIHTYSLIHDDMPEMDNDDWRRGRLACHKQFGVDVALLAGDSLQSLAFEQLAKIDDVNQVAKLCLLLAQKIGANGMCYGQDLDLKANQNTTLEQLIEIETYKTGCLIALPLMGAAILAHDETSVAKWEQIGHLLGIQFQIQDDLLEITSSVSAMGKSLSDQKNDKATALNFFSLEEGQAKVQQYKQDIQALLTQLSIQTPSIGMMIEQLSTRTK
ncbi:polyprenyl synthetase family protein [Allobaculum stercoricanis]|uniref:polyprenyl synthetase family protein n=1 Tax=Allobaculum stercoricanis TaxID=174709 RepID=UPI0023F17A73|nr:polyprenyl synthetase family protein [Allobaculum stercoricanis]